MDDILVINTKEQLDKYLKEYNCQTEKELDEVLWYNYGVTLEMNIKPKKGYDYKIYQTFKSNN